MSSKIIHILHVDDNTDFLKITKHYLEKQSEKTIKVDSFDNPELVLSQLDQKEYDVIVSDLEMPGLNGLDLLTQLREKYPQYPFIMFTGRGREEVAIQALNLGVNYYIKKGRDVKSQYRELIHIIQAVVRQTSIEKALDVSKTQNQAILDALPDLMFRFNQQGNFLWCSYNGSLNNFFVRPEEFIGKHVTEVLPPPLAEQILYYLDRTFQSGEIQFFNNQFPMKDRLRYFDARMVVCGRDEVLAIIRDITEHKIMAETIEKKEKQYQTLIETMNEGVLQVDNQDVIQFVSQKFADILEYDTEELVGQVASELFLIPENQEVMTKKARDRLEGRSEKYVIPVLTKSGKTKWLEISGAPVYDEQGQVIGSVGIHTDITTQILMEDARQKSDLKYQTIVDQMNEGLIQVDIHDHIQFVNQQLCHMLGYETPQDLLGKEANKVLLAPEDRDIVKQKTQLRRNGQSEKYEIRLKKRSGEYIWAIMRGTPVYNLDMEVIGSYGIVTDIHQLKTTSQVVTTLEHAIKDLEDFSYLISHDLKAPLKAIKILLDVLMAEHGHTLSDTIKVDLFTIHHKIETMNYLIENILAYSRIDHENRTPEQINLNDLVQDIIEIISPPNHIKIDILNRLPTLSSEKIKLHQLFQNLLTNAIHYNDKSEGRVTISSLKLNSNLYEFKITDNGIGIEKKDFETIFRLFETAKETGDSRRTGVGLAIVDKIIDLLRGQIRVESTPGEGSSFIFTLRDEYSSAR